MEKKEVPKASRKFLLPKARRRLVRTLSAILSLILCSKGLFVPTDERKWMTIAANTSPRKG